jgi:hypothetical protein
LVPSLRAAERRLTFDPGAKELLESEWYFTSTSEALPKWAKRMGWHFLPAQNLLAPRINGP